jgi:hypothetical protein
MPLDQASERQLGVFATSSGEFSEFAKNQFEGAFKNQSSHSSERVTAIAGKVCPWR